MPRCIGGTLVVAHCPIPSRGCPPPAASPTPELAQARRLRIPGLAWRQSPQRGPRSHGLGTQLCGPRCCVHGRAPDRAGADRAPALPPNSDISNESGFVWQSSARPALHPSTSGHFPRRPPPRHGKHAHSSFSAPVDRVLKAASGQHRPRPVVAQARLGPPGSPSGGGGPLGGARTQWGGRGSWGGGSPWSRRRPCVMWHLCRRRGPRDTPEASGIQDGPDRHPLPRAALHGRRALQSRPQRCTPGEGGRCGPHVAAAGQVAGFLWARRGGPLRECDVGWGSSRWQLRAVGIWDLVPT